MGYYTGTANNTSDIIATIVAACVASGWTHSSGVLSKGNSHVKLTTPHVQRVKIQGANDAGFTDVCPWDGYVVFNTWPVIVRVWVNESPDACWVHIEQANHVNYQFLYFGDIEDKVGTWTGGNFWSASRTLSSFDPTLIGTFGGSNNNWNHLGMRGAPFTGASSYSSFAPSADGMHMEGLSAGLVTAGGAYDKWADGSSDASQVNRLQWPMFLHPLNYRQPNVWNGQVILFHMHLYAAQAGGRHAKVGTLPHLRAVNILNHDAFDIITLGEEQWMVAPWSGKEVDNPNPSSYYGASGVHGFAVRYTP